MLSALIAAVSAATLVLSTAAPSAQSNIGKPEKFTAFAVDISNTAPRASANVVDIEIKRWSTESERDQLLKLFRERGQDGLLPALQKAPPIGSIRTPQSLAYDLHFSWQTPQPDGGRMIFLMTDRPINAWEAWNRPRTIDYPFTLIQLQVDKDGRGVGKASIATQIREENGTIVLENFSSTPVVLNEVRRVN